MQYPKIETLFHRDEATRHIPKYAPDREIRREEFRLPSRWLLTEKIDGTNIRIEFYTGTEPPEEGVITDCAWMNIAGRTDNAQIPPMLLRHLQATFPLEKLVHSFDPGTKGVLFGEGYGPHIQKGGGNYRPDVSFRLFDVVIFGDVDQAWWLDWKNIEDIANKLDIKTVPIISIAASLSDAIEFVEDGLQSFVARVETGRPWTGGDYVLAEGLVARTDPLLFDRRGHRLVWKLKGRDFEA